MQWLFLVLALTGTAADFYEPCTPDQALQALSKVQAMDPVSDEFDMFCQACSDAQVCCGCFSGVLGLLKGVRHELATLKVLRQVDVQKLRNMSARLGKYQVKLRRGPETPGLATLARARAALRKKFADAQSTYQFTSGVALRLADERDLGFRGDKTASLMSEMFWYFKEEQTMPVYNLLVQNHNTCLPDIFAGKCEQRHFSIFEEFPSMQGPAEDGFMLDFLGISMPIDADCQKKQFMLLAPGRTMQCQYYQAGMTLPRVWPVLDEEYLEWADSLTTAVQAAQAGRPFRMAELGSGPYGIWAMRAAKAFVKHAAPDLPCELLLVEPFALGDGSLLRTHTAMNLPPNRCKFVVHTEPVNTNDQVKALLGSGVWDLVDVDVDGAEQTMLPGLFGWLSTRVRRLHLSTHSRQIHWDFMEGLQRDGWEVQAHYPTLSLVGLEDKGLGRFLNCDGHISALPRFWQWR
ncbi:unnamed protein product [Symbiodinium natans]|uniref:Methyltransferase FkbM domain-containing protein n=1 Tax=Symbiodinium natans TaxID=878477 RepID=A0A812VED6_9DINO|nr:unnamed protein product [Symbiodinium natans]